jgi:hypothetical protein
VGLQKKIKKLTDYAKKEEPKQGLEASGESQESISREVSKQLAKAESVESSIIEEVLQIIEKKHKAAQQSRSVETIGGKASEKIEEQQVEQRKEPRLEEILEIARRAIERREIKIIECDKSGMCMDNRRIGEVYQDEHGIKWQRTFINTTRLPIFLDFLAEEAELKGRIGKAFVIETSRGGRAIIPDNFICEAISRYGILINIEKCTSYKSTPWAEKTKRLKKE